MLDLGAGKLFEALLIVLLMFNSFIKMIIDRDCLTHHPQHLLNKDGSFRRFSPLLYQGGAGGGELANLGAN